MPKVDMDMTAGTIVAWHAAEGDSVDQGAVLFEIETDKAVMEVESPASGSLHHISVPVGGEALIGAIVAWIYTAGERLEAPPAAETAADVPADGLSHRPAAAPMKTVPATPGAETENNTEKLRASPLARRLAREQGLALTDLKGTGARGRIVKADVIRASSERLERKPMQNADTTGDTSAVLQTYQHRPHKIVLLDAMRRTIATRLAASKREVPHFYLRRTVRLDDLLALRARANAALADRGVKLSINDFIIKAGASALQSVPEANAIFADDRIVQLGPSDVAVAVAVDGGLLTPVIRDADSKTISQISAEMRDLAERARTRSLTAQDYRGGTFTVSNLGMYGVESFDAIVNPPQASILAVGTTIRKQVLAENDRPVPATVMSVTLSVDHRVIDGALGAQYLQAIVSGLENPLALLA